MWAGVTEAVGNGIVGEERADHGVSSGKELARGSWLTETDGVAGQCPPARLLRRHQPPRAPGSGPSALCSGRR